MAQAGEPVIDLPDLQRDPGTEPTGYLKKVAGKWIILKERRPSNQLLVGRLRELVGKWRAEGYPGASEVTRELFTFWFEEEHLGNLDEPFAYYFAQREAIETIAYLVELEHNCDIGALIQEYGEVKPEEDGQGALFGIPDKAIAVERTEKGRQVRRYVPAQQDWAIQALPGGDLRRYSVKMATGAGKTIVMAMAAVWSYFHRLMVPDSPMAENFVVIAPNVIVYQRLERDFENGKIFREYPLIPATLLDRWQLTVKLRGEQVEQGASGVLVLTNVQQLYAGERNKNGAPNPAAALLGPKVVKGNELTPSETILEQLARLPRLAVINDEAHHVHEPALAWNKCLDQLDTALRADGGPGLALWLDFSATPRDQNGTYFSWIITDYPLAQAVEDRIVKTPLIWHRQHREDPDSKEITQENVVTEYGDWIMDALDRLEKHHELYFDMGARPVLFIMTEKNAYADAIGEWLVKKKELGLKKDQVLVIHTDTSGEVTKGDLEKAREAAREIDFPTSPVRVVVSVLMLREGWDVRNVSVILGLRPFTSKARILPEQAVGRGLRLMQHMGPEYHQRLEIIGTRAFEEFVLQLEQEGVAVPVVQVAPPPAKHISTLVDRLGYNLDIPLIGPSVSLDYQRLEDFDPASIPPLYTIAEAEAGEGQIVILDIAHGTEVFRGSSPSELQFSAQELLRAITGIVTQEARFTGKFHELYPLVKAYVEGNCFGQQIDLETNKALRAFLRSVKRQREVGQYLAKQLADVLIERLEQRLEGSKLILMNTRPFLWHGQTRACEKTVFNLVPVANNFEGKFAEFLDTASDVKAFAKLAEGYTKFRIDYVTSKGARAFYYPDWVVLQVDSEGELVHWLLETKGRVWVDTDLKDKAAHHWCRQVTEQTGDRWEFRRINQKDFDKSYWKTLEELLVGLFGGG